MMKTLRSTLLLTATASSLFFSCKREEAKLPATKVQLHYQRENNAATSATTANRQVSTPLSPMESSCTVPYRITLESVTANSNNTRFTWTWSVRNPNPGNSNGISGNPAQDLSHWNIALNNCCGCGGGATLSDVVSAATSANGTSWQSFTPVVQQDPSVLTACNLSTGPMLKFDRGTSGTAKTYYRLVLSRRFNVEDMATSIYKSGNRTGCGTICYPGIGCPE
jgi:hypothetical protein